MKTLECRSCIYITDNGIIRILNNSQNLERIDISDTGVTPLIIKCASDIFSRRYFGNNNKLHIVARDSLIKQFDGIDCLGPFLVIEECKKKNYLLKIEEMFIVTPYNTNVILRDLVGVTHLHSNWSLEISSHSRKARRVVILLSENSLNNSWNKSSIMSALKQLSSLVTKTIVICLNDLPEEVTLKKMTGSLIVPSAIDHFNICNVDVLR